MPRKNNRTGKGIAALLLILGIFLLFWAVPRDKVDEFSWRKGYRSNSSSGSDELLLCENMQCERWLTFRSRTIVTISAYVKACPDKNSILDKAIIRHSHEIKDEIRSAVTSADYDQLRDPNLKQITGKITSGMERIIGKGLFTRVLIPVWHISRG
ncbi:MAG: hypothetical protein KAT56_07360 [Sedimentisphaerales bacterium]|nr:hypothetical protein [Sedimentisphaerales bacterium]